MKMVRWIKKLFLNQIKKVMKKFLFVIASISFSSFLTAQITLIPDVRFEQALIDLGIDSDGIINGQVLTADVENIITLNISEKWIEDLTGIEDFVSLENLRADFNEIQELNTSTLLNLKVLDCYQCFLSELDLSNNTQLEWLFVGNEGDVWSLNLFEYIDLSNNPNIKEVAAEEIPFLQFINLNNGNNQEDMNLVIYREYNLEPICIQVDDAGAANSNQYPYSTWSITGSAYYSDKCTLSVPDYNYGIEMYPNPVEEALTLSSNLQIQEFFVYDLSGKVQLHQRTQEKQLQIDVKNLQSGMYLLAIKYANGSKVTKRFIKK